MDLKGETVFRRRPVRWVLESVTQERFRRGLLPDRIEAELVATRTAVAVQDHWKLPPGIRGFLNAHYLSVGNLRVLGRSLAPPGSVAGARAPARESGVAAAPGDSEAAAPTGVAITFDVTVPERYVVLAAGRPGSGWLDGEPQQGGRWLTAGRHVYRPAPGERTLALIWARAAENGYAPRLPNPEEP
jgi:hypothetical protein